MSTTHVRIASLNALKSTTLAGDSSTAHCYISHTPPLFTSPCMPSSTFLCFHSQSPFHPLTDQPTHPYVCQAAWAAMLTGDDSDSLSSQSPAPSTSTDSITLTGSDLIRGGEAPILLVSDTLGRIGLFRYPASLPESSAHPSTAAIATGEGPWAVPCFPNHSLVQDT